MRTFIQERNEDKLMKLAEKAGLTPTQWVNKIINNYYCETADGGNNAINKQGKKPRK